MKESLYNANQTYYMKGKNTRLKIKILSIGTLKALAIP